MARHDAGRGRAGAHGTGNGRSMERLAIAILVAAVLVVAWPWVDGWWDGMRMSRDSAGFTEQHETLPETGALPDAVGGPGNAGGPDRTGAPDSADGLTALAAEMRAANVALADDGGQVGLADPFATEIPGIDVKQHGLADGIVGVLEVPRLGLKLPVRLGASAENLAAGAAHLTHTSHPIGPGQAPEHQAAASNTVIAAHRDLGLFWYLDDLEEGDPVALRSFADLQEYRVVDSRVVDPADMDQLRIEPDRHLLTMVTCHPRGSNAQRLLVVAERVS